METLGAWGESTKKEALIRKSGVRVCENTGDPRATSSLVQSCVQRLAIDV